MPLALLVDDKDENLYYLRILLVGYGYEVQLARNGAEALELAHKQTPDLVIADILMPVMDGFTLCRRWQEDPFLRQVPFVFYTATYTEPKDEQLALSLGAARFLIKPKEPEEFMAIIADVLEEHGRHRLQAPQTPPSSEEQYLRQYNEALIHKLEDKLVQLADANRRLADKDAFNRAILDAMGAPVAAVGPDGHILAINQAWSRCAGQPVCSWLLRLRVGDNVLSSVEPGRDGESAGKLHAGLREVLEDRRASYALELPSEGEDSLCFMVRIERARSAGAGAVIAYIDVTEIKRAQQTTQAASRRKDEFLAVLGHELRNPLGSIRTAIDVLNRLNHRDPRTVRSVKIIDRQVANLQHIINDLLDISRIVRSRMVLEREPTDWAQVVRSSVEDVRADFVARGIALHAKLPSGPVWVLGDATRLAQVITNLLYNAQKFTEPGGRVEVEVEQDRTCGWSALRIRDNGVGMPAEMLSRIFEPFEQMPQGTARTRGGLGLGLALVRGLVELHGGEVRAESAGPGRGSTFIVRLPLTEAPALRSHPAELVGVAGAQVLIIEDNRDAAEALGTLLEMGGAAVAVAYDGLSGLELARERKPETILCDIGLPGPLNGYDVARALREEPAFRSTQLVAVTGYGQIDDVRRAKEAGFDLHLTKPVSAPALLEVVARSHEQAVGGMT